MTNGSSRVARQTAAARARAARPVRTCHQRTDGRKKRGMSRAAAYRLANASGLHAYRCEVCSRWHVGRTAEQKAATGNAEFRFHATPEEP